MHPNAINPPATAYVTKARFTEDEPGHFSADASDLGLRPGYVPEALAFDEPIGNGLRVYLKRWSDNAYVYAQELGSIEVVIFND